ncbi:glycosyltransferase family 4 protein [Desulfurococcus mucosus]|uniref:Glycosyl transferase group 1 n=1 Tax=Desulfurococcus mucosus (strain ATCC 35584 / DSM 2162 / JCM 9187 / O7/1) TaxID=765177 RepID=E8R8B0_DESM0|nr:glycosyltransferase family 4 protein [Desulfurococcus mucosus]ADV64736.1 glycosyl transferase group 1 [Desulfurococcus mucosus DSM 2162]
MRIVHIFHNYCPVVGGLEKAVQKVAEEQTKMGHEVHVITSNYGANGRPKEEVLNGVYVHRVRSWRLGFADLTIPLEYPVDLFEKVDVVHSWSQNSLFTYLMSKKAKRLRKPVVVYFLGVSYLRHHYNLLIRIFGYFYQRMVERGVVELADMALATNEYEAELLREKYGVKATVVPHGIDEIYLNTLDMSARFREKYRINNRIIAYVGRIHYTKGLDLLLKAFAQIAKQVDDTVLVIAGKGDKKYFDKCMHLAEKLGVSSRVIYVGFLTEEDKIGLIDASDVVVLPSRHAGESFPLLVYEVISRLRPIVVTNAGMLGYHVRNGEDGFVVAVDDLQGLSNAILAILKDRDLREYIKLNLIERRRVLWLWRDVASKFIDLYKPLVN